MLECPDMADEKDSGIDLVKYGVLWQRVQDMDKKMDKMERGCLLGTMAVVKHNCAFCGRAMP